MKRIKILSVIFTAVCIFLFTFCVIELDKQEVLQTSAPTTLSNKKIGWGIKRVKNHEQPDLGSQNKKIIDENNGIAMGSKAYKYVYLTFDEGYEAGYTEKILEVLKQNDVKAAFFITAHYVNTQPDLVKRMLEEGHIIRKPHCKS